MVPVLLIGAPNYPLSTWRQIIILIVVTTLVASTISTMVHRDRVYVSDLARQSLLAKRNADDADNARDRLETLLRAATGSAIMGVDPAGTVTFFSAGAELMLGYSAVRGGGHPLHRRLHRPGPDRRTPPDHRRHAQGARPGRPRDGGRSPLDRPPQERRAAALRGAGAHPPAAGGADDAGSGGQRRGLRGGGHRRDRARGAGGRARAPLLRAAGGDAVAH